MNEDMKVAWLEISQMLGEPTREELDVFLRTWQRASQATREALAEQPAQQEPVAYLCENAVGHQYFRWKKPSSEYKPIALYTSPPAQRTWVGLTKQEFNECVDGLEDLEDCWTAIEAKLKEKNT